MLTVNTLFERHYEVESLDELPSPAQLPHYYFPGGDTVAGRDGVLVRVAPSHGARGAWTGTFAFGAIAPNGASTIVTCPNPDQVCVVARGAGYLVDAIYPPAHERVEIEPILSVHPILSLRLLVFGDFLGLVAYGSQGLAWRTQRLSWDGLRIDEVVGHQIHGTAWSAPENRPVEFMVDLRNGTHVGGAAPPG